MRVLFVCTGNINRSAVASLILNSFGREDIEADSCGTGKTAELGHKVPKKASEVLSLKGIDPSGHRSKPISRELVDWADSIVCMDEVHRKHIDFYYPDVADKVLVWDILEPRRAPDLSEELRSFQQIKEGILQEFIL